MYGSSTGTFLAGFVGVIIVLVIVGALLGANLGHSEFLNPRQAEATSQLTQAQAEAARIEAEAAAARQAFELEQAKLNAAERAADRELTRRMIEEQVAPTLSSCAILIAFGFGAFLMFRGIEPLLAGKPRQAAPVAVEKTERVAPSKTSISASAPDQRPLTVLIPGSAFNDITASQRHNGTNGHSKKTVM